MGIDINAAIKALQNKRNVFCSEADFQLELAWVLKDMYKDKYDVRLEYAYYLPNETKQKNSKIHIDIVLLNDKEFIPIELKYKTRGCKVNYKSEHYNLANHGAQDIGRYLYLKDIERIECLRDNELLFIEGYAIFLTNDSIYKQCKEDAMYAQFSLVDNSIKTGIMQWINNPSPGSIKGVEKPISFRSTYSMIWEDYSIIETERKNTDKFYILTTKIIKNN